MGLKHGSFATVGVTDVTMVMLAFEAINKVRLKVELSRVDVGHNSDLRMTVLAFGTAPEDGDQWLLASTSLNCLATERLTLDAAVLAALYQLDFQLASGEFEKAIPK